MTTLDGYEMTKKGKAGLALGVGLLSSLCGGLFGVAGLTLVAPLLAKIALAFGPSEYFALGLLGLTAMASLGSKSQIKALISGLLGLPLATVGLDPISCGYGDTNYMANEKNQRSQVGAIYLKELIRAKEQHCGRKNQIGVYRYHYLLSDASCFRHGPGAS